MKNKVKAEDLTEGKKIQLAGRVWKYYGKDEQNSCIYVISEEAVVKCLRRKDGSFDRAVLRKGFDIAKLHEDIEKEIKVDGRPSNLKIVHMPLFTGILPYSKAGVTLFMFNDAAPENSSIQDYDVDNQAKLFEPRCCEECTAVDRDCTQHKAAILLRPDTQVVLIE